MNPGRQIREPEKPAHNLDSSQFRRPHAPPYPDRPRTPLGVFPRNGRRRRSDVLSVSNWTAPGGASDTGPRA